MDSNSEDNKQENGFKPCPICAEPIRIQAKKCIHCGEYLEGHQGWWWHSWLRFRPKTLWDLLSLLIIPSILILVGTWLNRMEVDRQLGLATAHASAVTSTAETRATEVVGTTRTAEVVEATLTAVPLRTAEAKATADSISARETLDAAQATEAVRAAETAKSIRTAEAEATANAIRAAESEATADAISARETIEAARFEGKVTAEAEATAVALNSSLALAAAKTAEANRISESIVAAQTAEAIRVTEAAETLATAQTAEAIRAAQTVEALATAQTAEAIRATQTVEALATAQTTVTTATILFPANEAVVGRRIEVTGQISNLRSNQHAFLIIQPESSTIIFPQGEINGDERGTWSATGTYQTDGARYKTFVVVTSVQDEAEMLADLENGRNGMNLPPDSTIISPIIVITRD